MTMISRGVEISIAGGGGEMVRELSIYWSQGPFIGTASATLTLITYLF